MKENYSNKSVDQLDARVTNQFWGKIWEQKGKKDRKVKNHHFELVWKIQRNSNNNNNNNIKLCRQKSVFKPGNDLPFKPIWTLCRSELSQVNNTYKKQEK